MKKKDAIRPGRVRTPLALQMEATECGAAALGMVLGYYGRIVPLAELRRECGVSRDGSQASNVCKAARNYGLVAKAFKKSVAALKDLRYPYIVFWNFNHFLVVEGCKGGDIYLNDPARGPRRVTLEEFDESFTGVVLVMEPGPDFRKGGAKPSIALSLWSRMRNSLTPTAMAIFAALLLVAPGLAIPALMQTFIDKVLIQHISSWGRVLIWGMLGAILLRIVVTITQLRILRRIQMKLAVANAGRFVWHLLRLPAAFFAQRFAGEISDRIALNDKVAGVLAGRLATSAIDAIMMLLYLAVMCFFDWRLALVAASFASVNGTALYWIARHRQQENFRLAVDVGKTVSAGISGIQTIRTLKASGQESDFYSRWSGFFANFANSQLRIASMNSSFGLLPPFLTSMMMAVILVAGSFRVIHGELTIGQLVAFQSLAMSFLMPVNTLVGLAGVVQELESDLSRLDDALANAPVPEQSATRSLPCRLRGEIELRNVSFGYSPVRPPLIENLSLHIKPGERIAFVGPSGSGKSTVLRMIAGLYPPSTGEILFDGIPAAEIARDVMTNSLAVIEQDISMFKGPVRDNLTLWDHSIPDLQMKRAAEDALVDETIRALPQGYQSELLEGATNLSGGQLQRLEIARALSGNPSILVMDEATSALDSETELLVDLNIRRRGCTCVIMAHRLSAIRDCDEIIVLDQGKIAQRGRHEDLISQEGLYARLLAESAPEAEAVS